MKPHFLYYLPFIFFVFFLENGLAQTQVSVCAASEMRLRNTFMDWNPGLPYDLGMINGFYSLCPNPGSQAGMVQSYFQVYDLLVNNKQPSASSAEALFVAYQRFNGFAADAREIADRDPLFARKLLTRAESLDLMYNQLLQSVSNEASRSIDDIEMTSDNTPAAAFAIPPGAFSSAASLTNEVLSRSKSIGEIEVALRKALQQAGFEDLMYMSAPAGFAILTQPEHIYPDGTPHSKERFPYDIGIAKPFSIRSYQLGLALARPGFYRAFALVVSAPGGSDSNGWEYSRGEEIPPSLALVPVLPTTEVNAFVFEFEVPSGGLPPRLLQSSARGGKGLSPGQHLALAGIWGRLQGE